MPVDHPNDHVSLDPVTFLHSTTQAVLIEHEDAGEVWLPLSLVFWRCGHGPEYYSRGDMVEIDIPAWLADAKNLI